MTNDRSEDATYENEGSTVTIPLREYDKLRERQSYITDKSLIGINLAKAKLLKTTIAKIK